MKCIPDKEKLCKVYIILHSNDKKSNNPISKWEKNIWTDFSLKKIKTANKHIQSWKKKSTQKAVKIIIIQEIIIKITKNTTKMNNNIKVRAPVLGRLWNSYNWHILFLQKMVVTWRNNSQKFYSFVFIQKR